MVFCYGTLSILKQTVILGMAWREHVSNMALGPSQ